MENVKTDDEESNLVSELKTIEEGEENEEETGETEDQKIEEILPTVPETAIEEDLIEPPSSNIEKYLEDTIYDYLKSQNDVPEHDFAILEDLTQVSSSEIKRNIQDEQFMLETIGDVLEDILENVENTRLFQQKYQQIQREHPQYPLFDMRDIIPDFKMDHQMIQRLCFRETLVVSNVDEFGDEGEGVPKAVGALCLHVQFGEGLATPTPLSESQLQGDINETVERVKKEARPYWEGRRTSNRTEIMEKKLKSYEEFLEQQMNTDVQKFIVHLSSDFDVDGRNAGSRLISWVDKKMHTLEERRTEYIQADEKNSTELSKQVLYFAMQPEAYYVKHMEKGTEERETRKYYRKMKCKDLIGEGANFVLMRYLAVMGFVGTFEFSTIYINGDMCRNVYECTEPYQGMVNHQQVELIKIYRTIVEENGIDHQCITVLSTYGKIISQEWSGCPYIFHVNPLSLSVAKPMFHDMLAMKKLWETDMELMSKYLDCKTEAELKMKTYLKDHPEVQNLMADYIQSILLLKPENILAFTQDFFLGFEPYRLPSLPYFEDNDKQGEDTDVFW